MIDWRLLRRPSLFGEAIRTAWAFRSRRGLLPARSLLRWRVATAYGDPRADPAFDDLVAFLRWRREFRRAVGGRG